MTTNPAIAWDNQLDGAMIMASSEVGTLPVSNVQEADIRQIWRAETNAAWILADFGGQLTIGGSLLVNTNLAPDDVIRIRLSTTDSTGAVGDAYDSGDIASGVDQTYRRLPWIFSATGRYLRIDMTQPVLPEVGRWFVGPVWLPSRNFTYGWGQIWNDPSIRVESQGQQVFIDRKMSSRGFTFRLPSITESEALDEVFQLNRVCGLSRDVWVTRDVSSSNLGRDTIWGLLRNTVPVIQANFAGYDTTFEIMDRL